ncbi:MAG: preprotein translocase subunit SecE [Candidatus Sungbacteria bacterium]|nr:preprotein translocase subunit SecE [Candidatus Sungbacteria bacterium]
MLQRLIQYIKDSRIELKKVTWLTRREVMRYTIAVIMVSVVVALFLGGIDALLAFIITKFFL